MFVYVPWIWNYHAPATGEFFDYFRFSRDGIKYLFKDFSVVELSPIRGRIETVLNLIPELGRGSRFHKIFKHLIRIVDRLDERSASGFNVYILK